MHRLTKRFYSQMIYKLSMPYLEDVVKIEGAPYPDRTKHIVAAAEYIRTGTGIALNELLQNSSNTTLTLLRHLNYVTSTLNRTVTLSPYLLNKMDIGDIHKFIPEAIELSTMSRYLYSSLCASGFVLHPNLLFGFGSWWENLDLEGLKFTELKMEDIHIVIDSFIASSGNNLDRVREMKVVLREHFPKLASEIDAPTSIWNLFRAVVSKKRRETLHKLMQEPYNSWIMEFTTK